MLYVRTKGNIAEALSYNLLMYRGGHMGKRGIYLSKYIYGTPKAKNHARHLRKTMTREEGNLMEMLPSKISSPFLSAVCYRTVYCGFLLQTG